MLDENEIIVSVHKGIDNTPSDIRGGYSDGYHTFDEYFEFRKIYNAALFNEWALQNPIYHQTDYPDGRTVTIMYYKPRDGEQPKYNIHKSIRHNDGELCFGGGWFIVSAMLPTGLISNLYEIKDWDLFKVPEVEKAIYEYDGHTSNDVLKRLTELYSV